MTNGRGDVNPCSGGPGSDSLVKKGGPVKNLVFCAFAALVLAQVARAEGIINVTSDVPAEVKWDGEPVGGTPLTIRDAKKGTHLLKLKAVGTEQVRTVKVFIPASANIQRDVAATFGPPPQVVQVAAVPERHHHNDHVRRRNVALGVTALGIVTHSHLLTGIGIGGAVVNEIVHH